MRWQYKIHHHLPHKPMLLVLAALSNVIPDHKPFGLTSTWYSSEDSLPYSLLPCQLTSWLSNIDHRSWPRSSFRLEIESKYNTNLKTIYVFGCLWKYVCGAAVWVAKWQTLFLISFVSPIFLNFSAINRMFPNIQHPCWILNEKEIKQIELLI